MVLKSKNINDNLLFQSPESLAHKNGYLYTGILGGTIYKLNLKKAGASWEKVFQYGGRICNELVEMDSICGRPLGIHFNPEGWLVVSDPFMGVYKVDVENGKMEVTSQNEKKSCWYKYKPT